MKDRKSKEGDRQTDRRKDRQNDRQADDNMKVEMMENEIDGVYFINHIIIISS